MTTAFDQRGQTVHGDQINVSRDYIGHPGELELTPDEVRNQLVLYREHLCRETSLVNLAGIPLPGVDRKRRVSLQDVYIHIQALEEDQNKEMRKREVADLEAQMQKIAGEIDAHGHRLSLLQLLTLGEYYYRRGETVEQQERPAPVDPIQAAQDHQRLVLLGAPGSGKSTLLRYLAHQATASADGPIPILFPLSHFGIARAKDINATLREEALRYAAAGDPLILRALQQAVGKNQILWLLDGLDETQDKTVSQQISALPNQDRIVVTSRPIGYQPHQLGSFSLFEILPLTVDNSHKFIQDWMATLEPEGAEESIVWLEQQLHERPWLQPLTSNPLLLTFLVILACENPRRALPSTRHALYARYIDSLFTTWEKERNEKLLTLPSPLYHQGILSIGWYLHLAYFGHTLSLAEADSIKIGADSIPRRESISKRLADHLQQHEAALLQGIPASVAAVDIVTFWLTTGLLQERTWGEHTFLTFRHLTFQEYCVATMLHQSWQRQSSRTWSYLKPRLHQVNWCEPLLLLSEMMEPAEIDQLVSYLLKHPSPYDRALQRDIRLAAMLLGENRCASEAITQQVVKRLERLIQPRERQVWIVSAVMGTAIAIGLIDLQLQVGISIWVTGLVTILWILSCVGMLAFGLFPQMTVVLGLPLRLWPQTPVQTPFIEALGNISHRDAVQTLSNRFSFNEELYMRIAITKALANLGKLAIEPLLRIAADENGEVRTIVEKALVKTGKPAGELLLQELHKYTSANRLHSSKNDSINGKYYRANLAVYVLGEIGETRAVEPLLGLLNQQSLPVVTLARALGRLGDGRAAEPIAQLLPTEDWDDEEIVHSLSMLGSAAVGPLVRILLRNQWHMLEKFAAEALGKISDRRAIQPLLEVVCHCDSDRYFREKREWQAAEALSAFDDVPIQPLIDALISTKHNAAVEHALQQIGKPAVETLIKLFSTSDWELRGRVIDILHRIGSSAVARLLQELSICDLSIDSAGPLQSEQLRYCMGVITALGKRGNRDAIPNLIAALKTSNLWVLHASIQALGDIADKEAVIPLVPFLEHEEYYIRSFTLQALVNIKDAEAVPFITTLLAREISSHDENNLIRDAIQALGQIGGSVAVAHLVTLIDHHDSEICIEALKALGEAENVEAVPPLLERLSNYSYPHLAADALIRIGAPTVRYLLVAINNTNQTEQASIIQILSRIKSKESVQGLRNLLHMLDSSLYQEAKTRLKVLEQTVYPRTLFDSPHIDAVLKTGDSAKIADLVEALQYGLIYDLPYLNEHDRGDAVRGLTKAGAVTAVNILQKVFANQEESDVVRADSIKGLGKLGGDTAIGLLIRTLSNRSEEWRVRCGAVRGLRYLQYPGAIVAVKHSLNDIDYSVRKTAIDVVQEWTSSGKLEREEATEWLVAAMRGSIWKYRFDPFTDSRTSVISLLASIGTISAIKPLLKLQYSYSARVREYVAYALGELASKMTNVEKRYVMSKLWWQLTDYGPILGIIRPSAQAFVALEKVANQYSSADEVDLFSNG